MAHHKSAIKRIRTSETARQYNRVYKKRLHSTIKTLYAAKDQKAAEEPLNKAVSLLDKMATKHIIHKNTAAHKKSTLMRFYNRLA